MVQSGCINSAQHCKILAHLKTSCVLHFLRCVGFTRSTPPTFHKQAMRDRWLPLLYSRTENDQRHNYELRILLHHVQLRVFHCQRQFLPDYTRLTSLKVNKTHVIQVRTNRTLITACNSITIHTHPTCILKLPDSGVGRPTNGTLSRIPMYTFPKPSTIRVNT